MFLPWIVRTDRWGAYVESLGQSKAWWCAILYSLSNLVLTMALGGFSLLLQCSMTLGSQ